MNDNHHPQSCASCGNYGCSLSYVSRNQEDREEITSYILDDVWTEYADYIQKIKKPSDQILTLGIFKAAFPARYQWSLDATHLGTIPTIFRHLAINRVKKRTGNIRQSTYLKHDQIVAEFLSKHIDYRANHLVIYQNFLPWMAMAGVLGGRSYDVLMTRYPLQALHSKLDEASVLYPESSTINDYRAPQWLVETELQALSNATNIITPHHDIAKLFNGKSHILNWTIPQPRQHTKGDRVMFIGPTIARQGAYYARNIAINLPQPLIITGENLENSNFWDGIAVEKRAMDGKWLDDVGTIIYPAIISNQPRKLLEAVAYDIKICATSASGLSDNLYTPIES